jgi:hypothetical protein
MNPNTDLNTTTELQALLRGLCAAHGVETLLRGLAAVCPHEAEPLMDSFTAPLPYQGIAETLMDLCDRDPFDWLSKATFAPPPPAPSGDGDALLDYCRAECDRLQLPSVPSLPPSMLCAVCGIANIHGPRCFGDDCPNRITR